MGKEYKIYNNINGLVLAGGKSTRMGIDKALLNYNGIEQQYYLYKMLEKMCKTVFISCNKNQSLGILNEFNKIIDNDAFGDIGPMAGLISYANLNFDSPVLLVACDYPHLKTKDLKYLIKNRKQEYDVVCFYNLQSGFDEPLIALYETSAIIKLKNYYNNGNLSLRHFLSTVNTLRLKPASTQIIKSIDNIEEAMKLIKNKKKNDRK